MNAELVPFIFDGHEVRTITINGEPCSLSLSRGLVTIVDKADFEWLSQWKWHAHRHHDGTFYAARNIYPLRLGAPRALLHRIIINAKPADIVDHINRDPLDNRRCNLRLVSRSQSACNRGLQSNNTTGFRGVYHRRDRFTNPWQARIKVNQRFITLGSFPTALEAARCYDQAALEFFGQDFAQPNLPRQTEATFADADDQLWLFNPSLIVGRAG